MQTETVVRPASESPKLTRKERREAEKKRRNEEWYSLPVAERAELAKGARFAGGAIMFLVTLALLPFMVSALVRQDAPWYASLATLGAEALVGVWGWWMVKSFGRALDEKIKTARAFVQRSARPAPVGKKA